MRNELYDPALEWMVLVSKLDAPFCISADDCVQKRKIQLAQMLDSTADRRDVEAAQAKQALAKVPDPPKLSFIQQVYGGHIDILAYEAILERYRQIDRSVAGEMALRLKKAQDAWATADKFRLQAQALARNEVGQINALASNNIDYNNAILRYPILNGYIKTGLDAGKTAQTLDATGFTDKYDALVKEMALYSNNSDCMYNKARAFVEGSAWPSDIGRHGSRQMLDDQRMLQAPLATSTPGGSGWPS
jgi:hypothetical protein